MSDRPRTGSSVPPRGDEAIEGSDEKKRGESDPLFDPPGLKRRSTFMGLAPAPHLGGLAGSPGAPERSEEEARRQQRIRERLEKTAVMAHPRAGDTSSPPPAHPREELVEVVPATNAGPSGSPAARPPAVSVPPRYGSTTMLMAPRTPNIPLTLPRQDASAKPAEGRDAKPAREASSPGFPSSPTVLIDPRHSVTGPPPPAPYGPPPYPHPGHGHAQQLASPYGAPFSEAIEPVPSTERMARSMAATPQSMHPPPPVDASAGLALRRWEPEPPMGVPLPSDRRLVLLVEPDSTAADAYRVLRDRLVGKNLPRVVAVSSPQQRDGKTTCAINLALALSEQPSTRVLLLDGNFFDPELARIFQMEKLPMLFPPEAETWLPPYRLAQVTPSLHLVAILPSEMPKRRFEQHRFEAMVDRLCRANYDYIIVDAPALQGAPAVVQLLAVADATLFAVRAGGGTTARELRRAAEQIPKDKALGVALIDG